MNRGEYCIERREVCRKIVHQLNKAFCFLNVIRLQKALKTNAYTIITVILIINKRMEEGL